MIHSQQVRKGAQRIVRTVLLPFPKFEVEPFPEHFPSVRAQQPNHKTWGKVSPQLQGTSWSKFVRKQSRRYQSPPSNFFPHIPATTFRPPKPHTLPPPTLSSRRSR